MSAASQIKPRSRAPFPPTQWSLILDTGQRDDDSRRRSLESLCKVYWPPVYAFLRRTRSSAEAEDLAQDFFLWLLEGEALGYAEPQRGRFRTFLIACLKRFLGHQNRGSRRRMASQAVLGLDGFAAAGLVVERNDASPERSFEKQWASSLLAAVLNRLSEDWASRGRADRFAAFSPALVGQPIESHDQLASRFGMSVNAVGIAVYRMKQQYGRILREEIARTLADPSEIDDEIKALMAIVATP